MTATDAAGNTANATGSIMLDTTTSVAYTGLSTASDTFGVGTTGTASDDLTKDTLPIFKGTAEVGAAVTVTLTGPDAGHTVTVLPTVVSSDGTWSIQPLTALANGDGTYSVAVSTVDEAGNTNSASGAFILDTTVPVAAPVLEPRSDSSGGGLTSGGWAGPASAVGNSSDDLTKDITPTFNVSIAEPPARPCWCKSWTAPARSLPRSRRLW